MSDFKTTLRGLDLATIERKGSLKTSLRLLDLTTTINQTFHTDMTPPPTPVEAYNNPGPLRAYSMDNTTVDLSWYDIAATSYTLQRATQSDYSDAAQIYSGSNKTYQDTGRTMGVTYYYRVKASKSGYLDSAWATASATTISFAIAFWYEMAGLRVGTDNSYGTLTGSPNNKVAVLKSIVNASGPVANYDGVVYGNVSIQNDYTPYLTFSNPFSGGQRRYFLASQINLTGDFTVLFHGKITTNNFLYWGDANNSIYMANSTTIQVKINGTTYNLNPGTPLTTGTLFKVAIKRSGSSLSVSVNEGAFTTPTTCNTSTHTINNLFGDSGNANNGKFELLRLAVASQALSVSQLSEFFNYLQGATFSASSSSSSITPKVTSWLSSANFINNYVNQQLDGLPNGSFARQNVWTNGSYSYVLVGQTFNAPWYSTQYLIAYDHVNNIVSTPYELPYLDANTDAHNIGSLFMYNNQLSVHQQRLNYGYSNVIRSFGANFDCRGLVTLPLAKGVGTGDGTTGGTGAKEQYHRLHKIGSTVYKFAQEFQSSGNARWLNIKISTDNLNNWTKLRLIDVGSDPNWIYYTTAENGTRNELYLFMMDYDNVTDQYKGLWFVRSSDGDTWTNLSGSYSKTISSGGTFTKAELYTNCTLFDARALAGSCFLEQPFVTSGGVVYGVIGNGLNTGHKFFKGTIGGSFTVGSDINYGGKTMVLGDPLTTTGSQGYNGFNRANPVVIWKGGTTYDLYALEVNGGAWRAIRFRSTDDGVNWTYQDNLTTDDTLQHIHIRVSENYEYSSEASITVGKAVDSTYGRLFVKKIS